MLLQRFRLCVFVGFSMVFLSSCGSSGGQAATPVIPPPPSVPTPPPTPTPPTTPVNSDIPSGGDLVVTSSEALNPVTHLGNANNPAAKVTVVAATHEHFSQALKVEVLNPGGEFWDGQILIPLNKAVAKDDVMLVHLYFRTTKTLSETGSGFTTVFMEGPAPDYTKYVVREIISDSEWQEYLIPVQIGQAFAKGGIHLKFGLGAGDKAQTYEIGGIELYNYGASKELSSLPKTELSYEGRALDAAWRADALERIETHRKGDFNLIVKNSEGQLVANADVKLEFVRHAYHFGSVIAAGKLLESSDDGDKYRQTLLKYFNQSGTENDLKWAPWAGEWGSSFNQQQTLEALTWLKDNQFYTRGHVLVWPSKRNLPNLMQEYLPEDFSQADPAAKQVVLDHIDDITQKTSQYLDEWDVLNEPFDNHYLMDAFGQPVMLDWFNQARINLPEHGLFINDYSILSGGGRNAPHQQHYEDTIRYLVDNNAPITGIGLQSHFGENLTPMNTLYNLLDRYHSAFRELAIRATEFDINTKDEQLQADYTRDFLILFFSHPATVGVQLWGFWAGQHWLPEAAMFTQDWQVKPNAEAWYQLIYQQWWNNFSGTTNDAGTFAERGFYGDYQVTVTEGETSKMFDITVTKGQIANFELVMDH